MSYANVIHDRKDKFREGAINALLMRTNHTKTDHSNEFLSASLFELCKMSLDTNHINYSGFDKRKIVGMAMSQPGSDFPGILENVANKEVLRGYSAQPEAYTKLARIGSLPDFKIANRSGISSAPSLLPNAPLQEVETITLSDRGQNMQLSTFAARAGISRQAIINDDLGEFGRMLVKLGEGAKRTVGDQFANVMTQHADGQMIDEGGARIFDAARMNTGTGSVPSTASFSQFRSLMATQTDVGGATNLNIRPRYIYCPVTLEGAALVVAQSENEVGASRTMTTPNIEKGRWEVVTDARLDAVSATRYYGMADPNQYDTVEVAFLDGRDEPMIERIDTYDVLGVSWVVWIDCVAQALDFRTMAVNDGV
jgi:hypothetical protein